MTNPSLFAAFERVRQYIASALSSKSDIGHKHDDVYYTESEIDTKLSGKASASHDHNGVYYTETEVDAKLDNKVDKVTGKGLSANDYTTAEKNKLSGIEDGAQVNVQSNWNQNDPDAADYIKNRTHWAEDPKLETIFEGTVNTSGVGSAHFDFIETTKPFVEGEEYLVTLNGTQYWQTARFDGDFLYIGDNTYKYTTIPFFISNDNDTSCTFETNKSATWNLKIQHNNSVVHQLDERFIPDTIARAHSWTQIYDSGAITANVNAFSNISFRDYKRIMVAIKVVNTTSSSGNTGGAITFIGRKTGTSYAFRNILPDLIKNTSGTTGGMAIFKIVDGFIICENAMRSTNATNMLSTTEGAGADNLVPVGSGIIACSDDIAWFYVGNTNSSKTHYYGAGSRIVVWGCKE